METEGLFIFARKSLFSYIYIQSSVMAGYIYIFQFLQDTCTPLVSCHAGYLFFTAPLRNILRIRHWRIQCLVSLPAVACMTHTLSSLSVMAGYMPSVSSRAGYLSFGLAFGNVLRIRHWRIPILRIRPCRIQYVSLPAVAYCFPVSFFFRIHVIPGPTTVSSSPGASLWLFNRIRDRFAAYIIAW